MKTLTGFLLFFLMVFMGFNEYYWLVKSFDWMVVAFILGLILVAIIGLKIFAKH